MDDIKILKGNIIYTKTKDEFEICEHGYLVGKDGKVEGIYQTLPFRLGGEPIEDHGDCLIIPGMTDLHIHAPQYTFRGTGMDMELLEWLETNTFPEEAKYKDVLYANEAYAKFAKNLKHSSTTRACVFGTIHRRSTLVLMDHLERSGLVTMVEDGSDALPDSGAVTFIREFIRDRMGKRTLSVCRVLWRCI